MAPDLVIVRNYLSEEKLSEIMVEIEKHEEDFVEYDTSYFNFTRWSPELPNKLIDIVQEFIYNDRLKQQALKYRDHAWRIFVSDSNSKFEVEVTKYYKEKTSRCDWHIDHLRDENGPGRILNYILYLNDGFEGGELQLSDDLIPNSPSLNAEHVISQTIKPERNMLVVMPAWVIHKVLPVTSSGPRLTLNGHIQ